MKSKLIYKNIICSVLLQLVTIISGFVIPKVILSYFGSSVNGLISSINQFLNYIQLLEGGLSGVVMAALYKPLAENDSKKVSAIVKATQNFFHEIGCIYIIYTIAVAFIYPLIVNTSFSYTYSVCLVLVLALNLLIQYFFSLSYKLLLNADKRVYFVSLTQIIIVVMNMAAVVITAKIFHDILIIKLASGLIFFVQPIMYGKYVNKNYKIEKDILPDKEALSQRWNGFGINIAYFIHTNTDVIILTFLASLADVSIYSVYVMIVNALKSLVLSVSQAILPSFGQSLATDSKKIVNQKFNEYEFVLSIVTVFLFGCGIVLLTPFVDVYTSNIHDANYHQVLFGVIIALAEMTYCLREPYISATYSAGHFKQVSMYAYIEAGLNIFISLLLVKKMGIVGVAIGTLISMIYRMICHIYYLKNNILYRPIHKAVKSLLFSGLNIAIITFIGFKFLNLSCSSYVQWVVVALETVIIAFIILFINSMIFYRKKTRKFILSLKKH